MPALYWLGIGVALGACAYPLGQILGSLLAGRRAIAPPI